MLTFIVSCRPVVICYAIALSHEKLPFLAQARLYIDRETSMLYSI